MAKLIVGFDSAWRVGNSGALLGVLDRGKGELQELGTPQIADFAQATAAIEAWRIEISASATIIFSRPTDDS